VSKHTITLDDDGRDRKKAGLIRKFVANKLDEHNIPGGRVTLIIRKAWFFSGSNGRVGSFQPLEAKVNGVECKLQAQGNNTATRVVIHHHNLSPNELLTALTAETQTAPEAQTLGSLIATERSQNGDAEEDTHSTPTDTTSSTSGLEGTIKRLTVLSESVSDKDLSDAEDDVILCQAALDEALTVRDSLLAKKRVALSEVKKLGEELSPELKALMRAMIEG
jgi:hypothetical protein